MMAALDWAVAKCEGYKDFGLSAHARGLIVVGDLPTPDCYWCPSTNWAQAGPIIEKNRILLAPPAGNAPETAQDWYAQKENPGRGFWVGKGQTPLIAAMRCLVAAKLGDEVEIPQDLMKVVS